MTLAKTSKEATQRDLGRADTKVSRKTLRNGGLLVLMDLFLKLFRILPVIYCVPRQNRRYYNHDADDIH